LILSDVFLLDTYNMVVAKRREVSKPRSIAVHPAPQLLAPAWIDRKILVLSNSEAARICAEGAVDACITTKFASDLNALEVLHDYGPVAMGFTIHVSRP